ncbi:hypothetical protein NHX12_032609, partial [Muraenolepis orangiensis]
MREDVALWCSTCTSCASKARPRKTPQAPMGTVRVGAPMERIALDIMGPLNETDRKNSYVLVVQDYFTKWVEAYPLPNQQALTVAEVLASDGARKSVLPLHHYNAVHPEVRPPLQPSVVTSVVGIGPADIPVYLLGRPFTVRTDRSSLRWLTQMKKPEGQLARWLETLGDAESSGGRETLSFHSSESSGGREILSFHSSESSG